MHVVKKPLFVSHKLDIFSDKPANESLHAEPGQGGERALPAGGALPGNGQQVEGGADARDRGVHQSAAAESHHRPDALLHSAEEEPLLHVLSSRAVRAAVSSRRSRRFLASLASANVVVIVVLL